MYGIGKYQLQIGTVILVIDGITSVNLPVADSLRSGRIELIDILAHSRLLVLISMHEHFGFYTYDLDIT